MIVDGLLKERTLQWLLWADEHVLNGMPGVSGEVCGGSGMPEMGGGCIEEISSSLDWVGLREGEMAWQCLM